jgi:hypothetical protein
MIQNPYANKKRKAPSSFSADVSITNLDRSDAVTATEATASDGEAIQNTDKTTASLLEDDGITNEKCDEEQKDPSCVNDKENVASLLNIDIHYGQRLPSQRLTFGSATILTVPEVYQQLYSTGTSRSAESTENPIAASIPTSIRVTGVVVHHHVHVIPEASPEDTVISMILVDPLRTTPQYPKARRSLVSFAPKPTQLSPPLVNTVATNTTVAMTDAQKKKPVPILVYRKKATSSSLLSSSSNARRLSFAAAVTEHPGRRSWLPPSSGLRRTKPPSSLSSLEQLVQRLDACTMNHSPCVWILVRLSTTTVLGSMQVNDLITVFGEVRRHNLASHDDHASPAGCAMDVITAAAEQVRRGPGQEEEEEEDGATVSSRPSSLLDHSFVQARIVRNANGTNMQLFTNALYARRRFLES